MNVDAHVSHRRKIGSPGVARVHFGNDVLRVPEHVQLEPPAHHALRPELLRRECRRRHENGVDETGAIEPSHGRNPCEISRHQHVQGRSQNGAQEEPWRAEVMPQQGDPIAAGEKRIREVHERPRAVMQTRRNRPPRRGRGPDDHRAGFRQRLDRTLLAELGEALITSFESACGFHQDGGGGGLQRCPCAAPFHQPHQHVEPHRREVKRVQQPLPKADRQLAGRPNREPVYPPLLTDRFAAADVLDQLPGGLDLGNLNDALHDARADVHVIATRDGRIRRHHAALDGGDDTLVGVVNRTGRWDVRLIQDAAMPAPPACRPASEAPRRAP